MNCNTKIEYAIKIHKYITKHQSINPQSNLKHQETCETGKYHHRSCHLGTAILKKSRLNQVV